MEKLPRRNDEHKNEIRKNREKKTRIRAFLLLYDVQV